MSGERLICSGPAGVDSTSPDLTTNHPRVNEGTSMAEQQSTVEYRDIPGFPGYRVGDDGSVWSCWKAYRLTGSIGGCGSRMIDQWHPMNLQINRQGRPRLGLWRNGKQCFRYVCRLVLEAFAGPCPPTMEACHFPDRNPENNHIANLRWDTRKANAADRVIHGTSSCANHPNTKLNDVLVGQIKSLLKQGLSCRKIGPMFGVTSGSISSISRGLTWKHVAALDAAPNQPTETRA